MNRLPDDPPLASALFADRRPQIRPASLEELDKIVENSSEKNRNFFIAYLGLLVYVQAIVFSTTDLQLLTSTELKLPIVDLAVPLVGFYVVVPIFVIALHFNFLQNLESHHYKLMRWRDAHPGGLVPRSRIQPFLFDYATLETGSQMERWVRWANSLLVLNLAPITLGLLLWRYTDRQEAWVTVWHYLAFLLDGYLVWKLRLALRRNREGDAPEPPVQGWWRRLSPELNAGRFLRDAPRHGMRGVFGLFLLAETLFTVAVSVSSSEAFVARVLPLARTLEEFQRKNPLLPGVASLLLPRIAIDPGETVWRPDPKVLEAEARMAGETDWVKYFNQHGEGFRPSTDHLRLADLSSQRLPRAQLRAAKLEGADLSNAQLQGADLSYAQLQGAALASAQLQGTNLIHAQLQASHLEAAEFQGARLLSAQLQGAYLRGAQLQGADLRRVQLQGAHMEDASLQGASLEKAHIQGADLEDTDIQGVNLEDAQLQGVDLEYARLQGAYLGATQLQGANLWAAWLQGADLEDAQLQGAILNKTGLRGARAPDKGSVFEFVPPFDPRVDWQEIEKLADTLPSRSRNDFLGRIRYAQTWPATAAEDAMRHDPAAVHRDVLPELCGAKDAPESRRAAIRGIRRNYRNLEKDEEEEFKNNPELQSTLTEIDRTLCTLPACADLKDDIEGLDCGSFAATKSKPASKR